jgi:hypothetical protein
MPPDSYSVAESADLLGCSTRRVRQLAAAGRLVVIEGSTPLQLTGASVRNERGQRRKKPRNGPAAPALTDEQIQVIVARTIEQMVPKMLEASESASRIIEAELHETRAQVSALEIELEALKIQSAKPRWKLFRR